MIRLRSCTHVPPSTWDVRKGMKKEMITSIKKTASMIRFTTKLTASAPEPTMSVAPEAAAPSPSTPATPPWDEKATSKGVTKVVCMSAMTSTQSHRRTKRERGSSVPRLCLRSWVRTSSTCARNASFPSCEDVALLNESKWSTPPSLRASIDSVFCLASWGANVFCRCGGAGGGTRGWTLLMPSGIARATRLTKLSVYDVGGGEVRPLLMALSPPTARQDPPGPQPR